MKGAIQFREIIVGGGKSLLIRELEEEDQGHTKYLSL